jgi:hypothetical protein
MVSEVKRGDTVLTGLLADRSALFGVLAQIEALNLDLVELREVRAPTKSPGLAGNRQPIAAPAASALNRRPA